MRNLRNYGRFLITTKFRAGMAKKVAKGNRKDGHTSSVINSFWSQPIQGTGWTFTGNRLDLHFVSVAAGSVRHRRRQGVRVNLYSSKGSLMTWENRLDLRVASASPGELDGRLSVGKPTHRTKHFCSCASWAKFRKWGRERRRIYFKKIHGVYIFRHGF